MVLHNRRQHGGFFAQHNTVGNQRGCGVHHVGIARNARQRLFDTFHLADGNFELTADMRVSPNPHRHRFQTAGRVRRQGNAAAHRQTFHQHTPALAGHFRSTDDVVNRHKDILTASRAVLERYVQREMTTTNFNPRGRGWDQRTGNAQIFFTAQQFFRVRKFERQTEYGGDRRQGDITFVPGQAHAQHLFALPFAHADHASIRDRTGIRTGFRAGQREARNFLTTRQTRQIVIFLLFRTVML